MSLGNNKDLLLSMAKKNQNLSFLKSDKIGLTEEATVKVSCLLQLFDRCLRCKGEAYSLVTHREGAVFSVAQMCWSCQFTVTWASHSKLADVQNEQEREKDGNEAEEEESDQDMEEEEEEEKQPTGKKRKRRDSDEEWAPDVQEFTREFVRQSSDDSEGSSCEEDEDNDDDDDDDGECASELLVWCSECRLKITNSCLRHKHPLLYCCVLCGYAEPHEDCTGIRGTESTRYSEEPLREASFTNTPEGGEAERSSGQQVDCTLQHATTGMRRTCDESTCDSEEPLQKASFTNTPEGGEAECSSGQQIDCSLQCVVLTTSHLKEASRGPEGPTSTNDNQDGTDHIQPISATTEGQLSINNQSGATTEVPHSKNNQLGVTSEGPHSANDEIQDGNTGCELKSSTQIKPPFAVYFSDPYNLQSHMEEHHYNQWQRKLCTDCGKFFIKPNAAMAHDCEHKAKPFICATCEKRFSTEAGLHTHQYVHKEERLVHCQFCFKGFRQTVDKVQHEESHQAEVLKFYCRECPKRFADRHSRSVHRKTHWTEDRFFCKYCDKGFKEMHHLRRHKLLHTGKKPFPCEVCDRSFNQSGHLKSHMRLHTGERPFKCQQCERSFNHNVSLKNHLQRHHGPKTATAEQENQE
ncbi:oocyte zinc finger protein XlCOF7.1-like [Engraulis encrasicolus]|uniref:oocyte zinc finger protein XlCOF7.1-like n=1 Tax=Engraulis encrasicolus TaxID=184585 RepID=UPI002FCFF0AE